MRGDSNFKDASKYAMENTREIRTNKLIAILDSVKEKITDDSDVVWSNVDSPAQLRAMIDDCITGLQQRDSNSINRLHNLFAATGKIQEHSISNGWGEEFLEIAEQFDNMIASL